MAKAKKVNAQELVSKYMDYVLEHGKVPKSVSKFAKKSDFKESDFYKYFNDFKEVEKQVFSELYSHTITLLEENEEYKMFDARNKLLSFYFTFFEMLTVNRDYVVSRFSKRKKTFKCLSSLSDLEVHFKRYIQYLEIETLDLKNDRFQKIQDKSLQQAAWFQLLVTLKFWIDDTSPSFEKTDVFIEKAINTSFDLINTKPLKSVLDFGKFIIKEKWPFTV